MDDYKSELKYDLERVWDALYDAHIDGLNWECECIDTPEEAHSEKVVDKVVDLMAEVKELIASL